MCLCLLGAVTASLAELSGASLDRINYHVEYHYLDDEHQGGKEEAAYLAPRGQEVIMTRHDGTRFNCTLPRVEASASSGQTPNVPRPSVVSLLAPLKHNCLYRVTHARRTTHDTHATHLLTSLCCCTSWRAGGRTSTAAAGGCSSFTRRATKGSPPSRSVWRRSKTRTYVTGLLSLFFWDR